jgi:hypothetical protein
VDYTQSPTVYHNVRLDVTGEGAIEDDVKKDHGNVQRK